MDMQKLERAIIYVERIANGYNPVNNNPVQEDTVLNNPNVIRCMYFIKDILKEVYNNGGAIGKKGYIIKEPFDYNVLNKYTYLEDKSITHLFRQINEPIENTNMEKVKYKPVIEWLRNNGYLLTEKVEEQNHDVTTVTEKGKSIGIYNEIRTINDRSYLAVIYNKEAQEFIVNNLENILKSSHEA